MQIKIWWESVNKRIQGNAYVVISALAKVQRFTNNGTLLQSGEATEQEIVNFGSLITLQLILWLMCMCRVERIQWFKNL